MNDLLKPGQLFADRYKILGLLGKGGFGEVYRACQIAIPRDVALKVICADGENRAVVERFRREAQHISTLQHPNTITLFDYGECDGMYFISMEVLEGQTLAEILEESGPMQVGRAVGIFEQALRSLSEAHGRGLVHRDLKPENIFVLDIGAERDVVKVLDFGIARAAGQDAHLERLTIAGTVVGTPYYMAPEQALGWEVAPWTDVYAMGLILFEMLTGCQAFSGKTIYSVLNMQVSSPTPHLPEPLRHTPLNELIQHATIKQAQERFHDAQAFLTALRSVPDLESFASVTLSPPSPDPPSVGLSAHTLLNGLLDSNTQDSVSAPTHISPSLEPPPQLHPPTQHSTPIPEPPQPTNTASDRFVETQLLQSASPIDDAALRTHIFSTVAPPVLDPTDCFGRDDILDTLAAIVDDVTLSGKAHLAFVTAPSGQGRTTLLRSFQETSSDVVTCLYIEHDPTQPDLAVLHRMTHALLDPKADPDEVFFALAQNLAASPNISPTLNTFLDHFFNEHSPPDATTLSPHDLAGLFQTLERFLLQAATHEPLCLILDELHCLDDLTVQFMGYFLSSIDLQTQPIVLVASFCTDPLSGTPAILNAFERLAIDRGLPTSYIHLRPLSKAHAKHLVHSMARVSDTLFDALWTQTHGNPDFLVHATHQACSEPYASWDGAAWSLQPNTSLPVPPTLSTRTLQRLDALFPDSNPNSPLYTATLQWIAALGDEVDKRNLAVILRKDPRVTSPRELDACLDDLTHLGLLHRTAHNRSELLTLTHPLAARVLSEALHNHPEADTILRAGQRFLPQTP